MKPEESINQKKWVILAAVVTVLVPVGVVIVWNYVWGKRGLLGFVKSYPDAELRGAVDGQFVKVTGGLLPVAVFLWKHLTKGFQDVYIFRQNYVNLKDVVASPQTKIETFREVDHISGQQLQCRSQPESNQHVLLPRGVLLKKMN